jgi:hypothetical protein
MTHEQFVLICILVTVGVAGVWFSFATLATIGAALSRIAEILDLGTKRERSLMALEEEMQRGERR